MKKLLSVLLALSLLASLMPMTAFAADEIVFKADKTYIVLGPDGFTSYGAFKSVEDGTTGYKIITGGIDKDINTKDTADIKICLPKDGVYKIYALSKDFTTNPGIRFYDIRVGDTKTFRTGNHGKQGYFWQSSDAFSCYGGEMPLSVIDASGNYARCAAIVITDDLSFNPSSAPEAVKKMIAERQYKEGDLTYSAVTLEGRPDSEIAINLNGQWMTFDVDPVLMNDRTMVPFRAIFEALGCTVSWDDENQVAKGQRNGVIIELPIGYTTAKVGDMSYTLDQPAVLKDSRTLVPLRFVSEALGAQVKWDDPTQTVSILAPIPDEMVLFGQKSYSDVGTWSVDTAAGVDTLMGEAMIGTQPGSGSKLEDADTTNNKPAIANFSLSQGGTYRVWVSSRDFATNQQGDRFFQVSFNDQPMMEHKYGTHGGTGYAWASGGTVELPAGENTLYVHDTSGFFARFDGILLSKDLEYVPSSNYADLSKLVLPYDNTPSLPRSFPLYANEQSDPTESYSIESEQNKVVFYKVPTSKGQVIQNEIYAKEDGAWVKTKNRNEDLGYMVMQADKASYSVAEGKFGLNYSYTINGKSYGSLSSNPYLAGIPHHFIPTDYTVNGNSVTLLSSNEAGTLSATWSFDDNPYPLVSIDFTPAKDGVYSVVAWEGKGFTAEQFEYALAPFRIQYKRVPEEPQLMTEMYLFTPMGTYTLYENNEYSAKPVTKGVVLDPSWIPKRWVYKDNNLFGISMKTVDLAHRGTVFAPVLGAEESVMPAGVPYNVRVRMVSDVASWSDNYHNTVTNLFDVNDYRKNYENSLNEAIFNTRSLMLDDKYGGWDQYDKAHYNMEGMNVTSVANSMAALQAYLLSEDEEMLEKRAIPTLANTLTRGHIHFNRTGVAGGGGYWQPKTEPDPIGEPVSGFNANVIGGMYEMTHGGVPYLLNYGLQKGKTEVTNSYGSIASFSNDLSMYKYTGDKKYLDTAIEKADKYLENTVYAESTQQPEFSLFIYISYYPNLASLVDIYEVTGDKKYLDAAEYVAEWMTTGLWVPGVDGEKKHAPILANDLSQLQKNFHYGSETHEHFWWAGDTQLRAGRETLTDTAHNNDIITSRTREVEGWIPSRAGLGVEQASTFGNGSNIVMQSFVGDFMKLAAYTDNEFLATAARNAIIGRFRSYDGYYRNAYITYQQESNYPIDGPDYTGIYWHHIPPFLAMLEDFIINQTFAWSGRNISFPSLRQQGYAYFNSNQYGHEAGKFYDEDNMWAWLAEDTVHPDSIQVDWMAARKDGVAGIAFMNEDEVATTTTITLGEKFGADKNYTGTATLYDKSGKIGTVDVKDGKFTLTIPAKSLQAVKLNIASVKAPAYAGMDYSKTSAEIGGTISEHKSGKGYTLQMAEDSYFAYVYTTYKPADIKSATLTYTVDGKKQTETASVYPFEFIVKVDNPDAVFEYTLSAEATSGGTLDLGSGKLMTAKKSEALGIKYEPAESTSGTGSVAAEALKFEPTDIKLDFQGSAQNVFRFIVIQDSLPFEPTAENVVGLKLTGTINKGGEKIEYAGNIQSIEFRDGGKCVLVAGAGNVGTAGFGSPTEGGYSWEKLTIHPID
ncbi:MAG: glycoside hydrolase family 127 protein [Clostridia bacterium]|nr:glycoside hydrolase family 127 protein [Clostridia bacterium]